MKDSSGGYSKSLSGTVTAPNSRGMTGTKVRNPLQKNQANKPAGHMPSDCSRALTPKQGGSPE